MASKLARMVGGLLVAATAVTYHPALTAYVAMAGPVVLVAFVFSRGLANWRRIALSVVAIGVVGVALSLVSQLKSFEGFLKQYSEEGRGLGLTGFTSPADAFGFSLSFRDLVPATQVGRCSPSYLVSTPVGVGSHWQWLWLWPDITCGGYGHGVKARARLPGEQIALVAGAAVYVLLS